MVGSDETPSQGDADVGFDFRQGEEVFRDPSSSQALPFVLSNLIESSQYAALHQGSIVLFLQGAHCAEPERSHLRVHSCCGEGSISSILQEHQSTGPRSCSRGMFHSSTINSLIGPLLLVPIC